MSLPGNPHRGRVASGRLVRLLAPCVLLAVIALPACSKKVAEEAPAHAPAGARKMEPGAAAAEAMLAYEHHVAVRLPAADIVPRQQAVQAACNDDRFGECVVLTMRQQGGDYPSASVTVRIVPEGVEPMIAMAGEGAELGSRSTHAEDLAVVVRDNTVEQDRLGRELERLQEFQQRRDLAVADMIALSERLAATQAQLDAAEREGAQHRRSIDTQLLTLSFNPTDGQAGRNEVMQALRDFGATLSMGTAWTIRALAFLIPLAVLLAIVRRLRRRGLRRGGV